ncbi:MAG: hypothetical protein ACYC8T_18060 [Myxococcaceae bacterium]
MAVLFVASFGLYGLYWAYQQWKRVKASGADIWPIPRAMFLGFTGFDLFARVAARMSAAGLAADFSPAAMGAFVLLSNFLYRLPDPFWLVGLVQVVPLLMVQKNINLLAARVAPAADPNSRFTAWSVVVIVLGGVLWLLLLIGLTLPEEQSGV